MTSLIYLTLDLYTYYLRDGLGQDPTEIKANKNYFANKLPQSIRTSIIEDDSKFESEYVELLINKTEDIRLQKPQVKNPQEYEGYYYPVRLSDTYGLLFDCSRNDEEGSHSVDESLKNLKGIIPKEIINEPIKNQQNQQQESQEVRLGQTWMIYGQMPADCVQTTEAVARECYQALIPNADWGSNLQGTGHFLGGTIFELWHYHLNSSNGFSTNPLPESDVEDNAQRKLANNHHLIIILYPDRDRRDWNRNSLDKSADFITDWMRLFCYRHKIMYAYSRSLLLKHNLKNDFIDIRNYVQQFHAKHSFRKLSLEKLQKALDEAEDLLSSYGINLTDLNYQTSTIEINLYNYRTQLLAIQKKSEVEKMPTDLENLKKFCRYAKQNYQGKVQKDEENLTPGLKLLEGAVNLIRAEVEVERSTRDRTFQKIVGILGVAFGAGSTIAGISGQFTTAPSQKSIEMARQLPGGDFLYEQGVADKWLAPSISLVYSFTLPIFALILTGIIIAFGQRLNRRH